MHLKLTIETLGQNGSRDVQYSEIEGRQILIGRGAGSAIRLTSRFVSLKHAAFYEQDQRWIIEDLGSLSGVLVNGQPIARQILNTGDKIQIGDHELEILSGTSPYSAKLLVDLREERDFKAEVTYRIKNWDPARWLKFSLLAGLLSSLVIGILFLLFPFLMKSKVSWNPGPLSSQHRHFSNQCETCHSSPFSPVPDASCLQCHELTVHHQIKDISLPSCTSCHFEHQGDFGLTVENSNQCHQCHGKLSIRNDLSRRLKDIKSWTDHPDLEWKTQSENEAFALKFNHEIHMKGQLSAREGVRTLACVDCHETDASRNIMKPIRFKFHCQSCHGLEFDPQQPGLEVTHGEANESFRFILKHQKLNRNDIRESRRLPGRSLENKSPFSSRDLEERLFSATGCALCHVVNSKKSWQENESRFEILKPSLRNEWLSEKYPIHQRHESISCESCHSKARHSSKTSDILMPSIRDCQACHREPSASTGVSSPCSLCHSFHKSIKLKEEKQRLLIQKEGLK